MLVCQTYLRVWAQCPSGSARKIKSACIRAIGCVQEHSELLSRVPIAEFLVRKHWWRASDNTCMEGRKQKKKPNEWSMPCAAFQLFNHMLGVDTRGDEVRTLF